MAMGDSYDRELPRSSHAPAFEEKREDEVASLMEISRKLCLVQDPVEEPFRSKYKAREALMKARQIIIDLTREGGGGVDVSRGCTAVAVMETTTHEKRKIRSPKFKIQLLDAPNATPVLQWQ